VPLRDAGRKAQLASGLARRPGGFRPFEALRIAVQAPIQ